MRDLQKYLDVCWTATQRPWRLKNGRVVSPSGDVVLTAVPSFNTETGEWEAFLDFADGDMDFIIAASEGFEEAAQRALAAEERVKELEADCADWRKECEDAEEREENAAIYVEALHDELKWQKEAFAVLETQCAVLREAAELGAKGIEGWLSEIICDCPPEGHVCGLPDRERELRQIREALSSSAGRDLLERVKKLEAIIRDALPSDGGKDWWCPTCKRRVNGVEVTAQEYHEECGTYLGGISTDGWIQQALAALEGGQADNATEGGDAHGIRSKA